MDRRQWMGGLLALGLLTASRPSWGDGQRPTRALPVARTFRLLDDPKWGERHLLLSRLFAEGHVESKSLRDVLGSLNRRAHSRSGSLRLFRDSQKRKRHSYPLDAGFTWDKQDSRTTAWYPQGITGSGDATTTGTIAERRVVMVSWYARRNQHKGARVSLVDVSDLSRVRYRHLLLVEPVTRGGKVDFVPVRVHAGGIALYKNLLFVADTHTGIRVFDSDAIFKTVGDERKARVGMVGGRPYAFDYRFALPMVGIYRQPSGQNMRFSFVSLDRTAVPHSLWVGEYSEGTAEGFAANFPLDPATARLDNRKSASPRSELVVRFNRERTQGFVVTHRSLVLNHTYARDSYRLHVQTPTGYAAIRAPYGLEDLYYDPTLDRLWMMTEHPKSRAVFFDTAPDDFR